MNGILSLEFYNFCQTVFGKLYTLQIKHFKLVQIVY